MASGCLRSIDTSTSAFGAVRICVKDGFNDLPINGAKVVIAELDKAFYTDSAGLTSVITVPVLLDPQYEEIMADDEGRITLIVYQEGYTPYLLSYLRIHANETRDNITIYIYRDDGTLPVFSIIEGPDEVWAQKVVNKYKTTGE